MTATTPPDLAELQRRAAEQSAARARGTDLIPGHVLCAGLVRIYQTEGVEVFALQGLDLVVDRGEMVAIVGASGSGKSTLLSILSGLDVPTAGIARVAGFDLLAMSPRKRLAYRRRTVGFVWQQTGRNLLPYLTARENVELPMRLGRTRSRRSGRRRAAELLELVGVGHCANRRPGQLSGGEQQRVAIAVAVANSPEVLFADEPTGELDEATSAEVFGVLQAVNQELGTTIVVVTHDEAVSSQVQRTVAIRDGRTATEVRRTARIAADGSTELVSQEYALLDRAGRMQLPKHFVAELSLRDRVRLDLVTDHVEVRPAEPDRPEEPADGAAAAAGPEPAQGEA